MPSSVVGAVVGAAIEAVVGAVARRDRLAAVAGLVGVAALAWAYVLAGAGTGVSVFGDDVDMAAAMRPAAWTAGYAALMFFMWWIMMIAMMLPSAAPMILLHAALSRRQRASGAPIVATGVFAAGYLAAWGGFSVVAVAAQWGLERGGALSPMMASVAVEFSAAVLIAAGLWQMTPLKHACLRHCRAPIQVLAHHWRPGRLGALRMGLEHGMFCIGCCWFLMALLFYGGVMNLYWIGGVALYVLAEKSLPKAHGFAYALGAALVAWGAWLLFAA